ncbi:class I SAM-dependent methyltransferase [Methylobacillus gramineus]|uniref:N5-glutamine methyltransferase family protein n=1 Tax=Methylobacillus gramineus TaxID=755169 RepID=UPI001CFF9FC4|nr:class I SAM-dependent methyltransferase [Methylobacillus gramineus]MCB5184996.1 class I SAM-dependent methyltransferase [Methylobacillus gramineus]
MTLSHTSPHTSTQEATAFVAILRLLQQQAYQFTTISPTSHALVNSRPGNELAKNVADILGWSRPFTADVAGYELFALLKQATALSFDGTVWHSRLRVSSLSGRLFLHSAFPTSESDAIFFGPDTYRFSRAITQYLALHQPHVRRAVDIGCGSGVGAILLAAQLPQAQVYGVDINHQALVIASANGTASDLLNLHWQHSNLLQALEGEFDLIIANPPYLVDASERAYRHGGGVLGADLSLQIVQTAKERLAAGGTLLLYTGVAIVNGKDIFLQELQSMLRGSALQYEYQEMDPDIFGEELRSPAYIQADRLAAVVLTLHKSPS